MCWARWTVVLLVVFVASAAVPAGAHAQETLNATVTRVTDGDTLAATLQTGGATTVRLLGIDAPESVDPDRPVNAAHARPPVG